MKENEELKHGRIIGGRMKLNQRKMEIRKKLIRGKKKEK